MRTSVLTTDESSPHLEWHRRFGDGSGALGPREARFHVEISTYRQKVRPDRNLSRLRYLTLLLNIKERRHIDNRLCAQRPRFASCMGKGGEYCWWLIAEPHLRKSGRSPTFPRGGKC